MQVVWEDNECSDVLEQNLTAQTLSVDESPRTLVVWGDSNCNPDMLDWKLTTQTVSVEEDARMQVSWKKKTGKAAFTAQTLSAKKYPRMQIVSESSAHVPDIRNRNFTGQTLSVQEDPRMQVVLHAWAKTNSSLF